MMKYEYEFKKISDDQYIMETDHDTIWIIVRTVSGFFCLYKSGGAFCGPYEKLREAMEDVCSSVKDELYNYSDYEPIDECKHCHSRNMRHIPFYDSETEDLCEIKAECLCCGEMSEITFKIDIEE